MKPLQSVPMGLVIIVLLWLAVPATTVQFLRLDLVAGLLMLPYLLWVTIAAALNASVLRLNRA